MSLETFRKSEVDLVKACKYLVTFLEEVDRFPCLYANHVILSRAISRYRKIWLPLVAEQGGILVPPLDVEWIWHCHMLSPTNYQKDMQRVLGIVPDHTLVPRSGKNWEAAKSHTRQLWQQRTQEAFDLALAQVL